MTSSATCTHEQQAPSVSNSIDDLYRQSDYALLTSISDPTSLPFYIPPLLAHRSTQSAFHDPTFPFILTPVSLPFLIPPPLSHRPRKSTSPLTLTLVSPHFLYFRRKSAFPDQPPLSLTLASSPLKIAPSLAQAPSQSTFLTNAFASPAFPTPSLILTPQVQLSPIPPRLSH